MEEKRKIDTGERESILSRSRARRSFDSPDVRLVTFRPGDFSFSAFIADTGDGCTNT